MSRLFACVFCLLLTLVVIPAALAGKVPVDTRTDTGMVLPAQKKPLVIIYTLSTCPHCMEAKEYFTRNNIPFVNREVDTDSRHMEALTQIYDKMNVPYQKRGVPLILVGDSIRLQGFNKEKVQDALKKVNQK